MRKSEARVDGSCAHGQIVKFCEFVCVCCLLLFFTLIWGDCIRVCVAVNVRAQFHFSDQSDTTSVFGRSLYRNNHEDWSLWNAGDFLMTIEWIELIKSTINLRVLAHTHTHSLTWGHKVEIIQMMMTRFISQFCRFVWLGLACVFMKLSSRINCRLLFLLHLRDRTLLFYLKKGKKTLTHKYTHGTHMSKPCLRHFAAIQMTSMHTHTEREREDERIWG